MSTIDSYVYCIATIDKTEFKLGYTKNVQNRLRQLQTGNEKTLVVHRQLKVINGRKAEKYLHEIFAAKRKRGEWFILDETDLLLIDIIFGVKPADNKQRIILQMFGFIT